MKSYLYKLTLPFFVTALIFAGCKKEYETIEEIDSQEISAYLASNNLTGFSDTLGIYWKVTKPGTGSAIDYTKETPVLFTVRSLDGSFVAADTFAVYNRFAGRFGYITLKGIRSADNFRDIIIKKLVKSNGEIRMIIPSQMAYGRDGYSFFEGYTNLKFPSNESLDVTVKVIDNLPAYEDAQIKKYISDNKLTGFDKDAKYPYYYKVIDAGTGSGIDVDSTITVTYTGRLLNGVAFETVTSDSPVTFVLDELAKGWQYGLPRIKEGGSIRLIMPSSLAYGNAGSVNVYTGLTTIPAFSPLDFEIKVTDVAK